MFELLVGLFGAITGVGNSQDGQIVGYIVGNQPFGFVTHGTKCLEHSGFAEPILQGKVLVHTVNLSDVFGDDPVDWGDD
jgi:hypothetical protein